MGNKCELAWECTKESKAAMPCFVMISPPPINGLRLDSRPFYGKSRGIFVFVPVLPARKANNTWKIH